MLAVTALAMLACLWPATVSAGWFGKLFHKGPKYEPVRVAPHCQQYYGHFPTCWRTWPGDFQNCPPGEICGDPQYSTPQPLVDAPMPAEVAPPELPTTEPAPAPPTVPAPAYEEEAATPEVFQPPVEKPAELQAPEEAAPPAGEDDSSSLFLPPVRKQVSRSTSDWTASRTSPRVSKSSSQPAWRTSRPEKTPVQLEQIEVPVDAPSEDLEQSFQAPIIRSNRLGPKTTRAFPTSEQTLPEAPQASGEVAELLEVIREGDSQKQRDAVYRLGLLRDKASASVPTLIVLLKNPDGKVRMHAALALWRITEQTEFAVPVLTGGLRGGSGDVQSLAAVALGEIGSAAKQAVPTLVTVSASADSASKLHAAESLWKVAGKNANSIAVLVKSLDDNDVEVRWIAAFALAEIGPSSKVAVEALGRRLTDTNAGVREVSAFALGAIRAAAKSSAPQLLDAMNDENVGVRDAATRALLLIDP
jgi:hypothetical protein